MSEKKNIDRLFQEKFKDFEENPPEFIWDNIREELEEKKKKRFIPIWMRLSGVAAILVVGLLLGLYFINDSNGTNNNPVVIDNTNAKPQASPLKTFPTDKSSKNDINASETYDKSNRPTVNQEVVSTDGKSTKQNNSTNHDGTKTRNTVNTHYNKNAVVSTDSKSKKNADKTVVTQPNNTVVNNATTPNKNTRANNARQQNSISGKNNNALQQNNAVANNQSAAGINKAATGKGNKGYVNNRARFNSAVANNTTGEAQNATQQNNAVANKAATGKGNKNYVNSKGQFNSAVANNAKGKAQSNNGAVPNNAVVNNTSSSVKKDTDTTARTDGKNNTAIADANSANASQNNSAIPPASINKDVPLTETAIAAVDTVKPENELEKLLREKEAGKKDEKEKVLAENTTTNKWNVKPQLAPVFYNSLSQGSPIDGQFAGNTKSYENDLSYGVGVNYAVSKKITIRSGVNTLNLNYETQGVEFYASLNKSTTNVAARTNANIVVQNQGTGTITTPNAFNENQMPAGTFNGSMLQKTGYVEVPVEMAYALLDKKFGIDIIGGISTLFLNDNNVSVVSTQGYTTNVGQAQNLNSIHFSTNIGVGFKYRFFKSFEANFEPMFKYQVNTFSRDAGNFKPYFIGLYSGISFSF